MIQSATLRFLEDLKQHNEKAWFEANRHNYENAKDDIGQLVAQLIPAIGRFDEPISLLQVKECTFRINRDVRFSKNKSPYKSNMAAYFSPGGKKAIAAGYYFHCEPGKSYVAGGFYSPPPAELSKIRQEIDYNFDEWQKIVHSKSFRGHFPDGLNQGDRLVRPPKGYDVDNPAIEYLKMKHFVVSKPLGDDELKSKNLVKNLVAIFKQIKPMNDFLNRGVR